MSSGSGGPQARQIQAPKGRALVVALLALRFAPVQKSTRVGEDAERRR